MSSGYLVLMIFCCIGAYLIGSCNSAIIVTKLMKKEDIRNFGSKNAGLTNVLRCFGKGPAAVTLLCDLFKGIVTILIVRACVKCFGYSADIMSSGYIAGFMVMLGHIFPLYYGFKGGKGVLVAASVLIAIDIRTFMIVLPIFIIVLLVSGYVSLSSITAAAFYPVVTFILQYFVRHIETKYIIIHLVVVTMTSVLIIYMHRSNIKRLIDKTENKLSFSKK